MAGQVQLLENFVCYSSVLCEQAKGKGLSLTYYRGHCLLSDGTYCLLSTFVSTRFNHTSILSQISIQETHVLWCAMLLLNYTMVYIFVGQKQNQSKTNYCLWTGPTAVTIEGVVLH